MASYLPDYCLKPELGPKMYIAYGSALYASKGSTNLHIDMSDAVNCLGMFSHKISQITIFSHKHEIKNFIKKKFDIFQEKQWHLDFGSYLKSNF